MPGAAAHAVQRPSDMTPTHWFSSWLSPLLLLSLAPLTACADDPAHDARFTTASEAQIARALSAASGDDLLLAFTLGIEFSGRPSDATSCPAIVTTGADTTVSGDCTDSAGDAWKGQVVIHNLPGLTDNPAYDATRPGSIAVHGLRITTGTDALEIDGTGQFEPAADPSAGTVRGEVRVVASTTAATSQITLSATAAGIFTVSHEIDVELLGGAAGEGTWHSQPQAGDSLVLHGADDLTFDLGAVDGDGCTPYATGTRHGMVCDPPTAPTRARTAGLDRSIRAGWPAVTRRATTR